MMDPKPKVSPWIIEDLNKSDLALDDFQVIPLKDGSNSNGSRFEAADFF